MPRRPAQTQPSAPPDSAPEGVVAPIGSAKRTRKGAAPKPATAPLFDAAEAPAPAAAPKAKAGTAKPRSTAKLAPAGALPPARIPPESLRPARTDRLLAITAAISVAIHAVVLAVHFGPIMLKRDPDKSAPLEVALVNAKSKERPVKADVLAQANLDGGGNTDQDRRAKSPLPALPKDSARNDIAVATKKVQELERQAQELMTRMKAQQSAAVAPKPSDAAAPPEQPELPNANELMQRTLEAMKLEAQIAKDIEAYQKRPKRRFVGARAEEYRFARYVEDWRLKVERVGNLNYPEAARVQKLYGSLVLTVSIKSDGSLENVEVNKSSGKRILDAAAVKIVQMSAPYAPFPPDIRRDTDILSITRTWTFAKGDELTSQ